MKLIGGIEGGGTKFVCAISDEHLNILEEGVFPTRSPEETLLDIHAFFLEHQRRLGPLAAYGVGSFGPLRQAPGGGAFVGIGNTPKPGWSGFPLRGSLEELLGGPVVLDTDVNCALRAELAIGAARGRRHVVYITVGTGIGGGICVDGRLINGAVHPEIGHMLIPKLKDDQGFEGICPFHGDRCVEGLASGPALAKRLGMPAQACPPDHPIWDLQAAYLAVLCHNLIQTLSPEMIVLGGGVMAQEGLLIKVRRALRDSLAGYCASEATLALSDEVVTAPALQGRAGVLGALMLARGDRHEDRFEHRLELCE